MQAPQFRKNGDAVMARVDATRITYRPEGGEQIGLDFG
jgi:hypothetical protein